MDAKAGAFTVRFASTGDTFTAAPDKTLLLSANAAGMPLPSSCRNGVCRTCMTLLEAGRVRYGVEWPGLLAEEKEEGWILPCVAYPLSDLVIASPE